MSGISQLDEFGSTIAIRRNWAQSLEVLVIRGRRNQVKREHPRFSLCVSQSERVDPDAWMRTRESKLSGHVGVNLPVKESVHF